MCEQCVTDMLSVYPEEGPYIGIARKAYFSGYEPGDILIGWRNDPDLIITHDLFSLEDWEAMVEAKWSSGDGAELTEAQGVARDIAYREEAHEFWHPELTWSMKFDRVHPLVEHFDLEPSGLLDRRNRAAELIMRIASTFEEYGIPLDVEGRLGWARQFHSKVAYAYYRKEEGAFVLRYTETTEGDDGEWDDFEFRSEVWSPGEVVPDHLGPYIVSGEGVSE